MFRAEAALVELQFLLSIASSPMPGIKRDAFLTLKALKRDQRRFFVNGSRFPNSAA